MPYFQANLPFWLEPQWKASFKIEPFQTFSELIGEKDDRKFQKFCYVLLFLLDHEMEWSYHLDEKTHLHQSQLALCDVAIGCSSYIPSAQRRILSEASSIHHGLTSFHTVSGRDHEIENSLLYCLCKQPQSSSILAWGPFQRRKSLLKALVKLSLAFHWGK